MDSVQRNNKRIALNTIFLYIRMMVTMVIGFYTSRVVLNTLGVSDYGVYNVMGGVIGMLGYVNTLLSGGTSRFLTVALGKGDVEDLKKTFAVGNSLGWLSAVLIIILGETIGLWFMTTQLNIQPERLDAAFWVYQCALLSSALMVIMTPFSASVISHEKMNVYAYMSIIDVVLKLLIVYMLLAFDVDKLVLYSFLIFATNVLNLLIYIAYGRMHFEECRFRFSFDKVKIREMFSYSGWTMISAFAAILNNYGLNILLNIFFGTIVNAARGIALQVNSYVRQFFANFLLAARPQIFKYCAQRDYENMQRLIINNSRFSGLLVLVLMIPISFNIEGILYLWLGQCPEYTVWFVRMVLLQTFCQAIDMPIGDGIQAVGKMRLPSLTTSVVYLAIFPLTWIALKLGASPVAGYFVYIAVTPLVLAIDIAILCHYVGFNYRTYISKALVPLFVVSCISSIFPFMLNVFWVDSDVLSTIIKSVLDGIYVLVVCFYVGVPKHLRKRVIDAVLKKVKIK